MSILRCALKVLEVCPFTGSFIILHVWTSLRQYSRYLGRAVFAIAGTKMFPWSTAFLIRDWVVRHDLVLAGVFSECRIFVHLSLRVHHVDAVRCAVSQDTLRQKVLHISDVFSEGRIDIHALKLSEITDKSSLRLTKRRWHRIPCCPWCPG